MECSNGTNKTWEHRVDLINCTSKLSTCWSASKSDKVLTRAEYKISFLIIWDKLKHKNMFYSKERQYLFSMGPGVYKESVIDYTVLYPNAAPASKEFFLTTWKNDCFHDPCDEALAVLKVPWLWRTTEESLNCSEEGRYISLIMELGIEAMYMWSSSERETGIQQKSRLREPSFGYRAVTYHLWLGSITLCIFIF